jgi:MFS family permease
MASGYPMLMASRMGVGVGEAAGAPPSYSIVSDYFPKSRRATAIGIFSLGIPFGIAAGAAFGAKIASAYGWRTAFKAIGAAGFVATIFMLLVVREPKRGQSDTPAELAARAHLPPVSFGGTVKEFFTHPVLLSTSIAAASVAFLGYGALNWTAPFLIRVKGITLPQLGNYYAIELALTMGVGTWGAGALADWLARRARYWYAVVPLIAMVIAIPFYLLFVSAHTWQMALVYLAIPMVLGNAYVAPAVAVIHNTVRPEQRTMAGALFLLIVNFIGLGFGPTYVGELSTHFTEVTGSNVTGLHTAMYWLTPFYGVAVALLCVEAYFLTRQARRDTAILAAQT